MIPKNWVKQNPRGGPEGFDGVIVKIIIVLTIAEREALF